MNELMTFTSKEFGKVRTVELKGEPWFVGNDVAIALGYSNPRKALADHVDEADRNTVTIRDGIQGNPNKTVISESGLYALVLGSKLPGARRFKHWVTSEVLPSVRRSGGYIQGQEHMTDQELLAKALLVAQRQIQQKDRQLEAARPKVAFADSVAASTTTILVGDLAKLLRQNGIEIGQQRLFTWLRDNGYLIKRPGSSWNMPTQRAVEAGLFQTKETAITHSDGHVTISRTVKVTGKGQIYFINLFLDRMQKEAQERARASVENETETDDIKTERRATQ